MEAAAASKLPTGGDRVLFAFVQALGKRLGFKLYLSNVCYKLKGDKMTEHQQCDYVYSYGDYGFDYDYDSIFGDDGPGNSEEKADNYRMRDTEEQGYSIEAKAVIDLDEANIVNGKLDGDEPDQKKFYYEDAHICSFLT